MPIRLLALDVDGTLTTSFKTISKANLDAIREAQRQGVFVTVATGRGYLASRPVWEQLHIEGPVINYGGAWVVDTRSDETILMDAIPADVVRDTLQFAKSIGVHAQMYDGDAVVVQKESEFAQRYCSRMGLKLIIDPDLDCKDFHGSPKILAYVDPAQEDAARSKFAEFLQGRAGVSKTQPGYIEINSLHASKGSALKAIAEHMGIPQREVAAIGDSYLDMSMISWAGEGVCVGDGLKEVKAISDIITPNCADDGVAWYIYERVLK